MLLDDLLTRLADAPPARELIGRLAVYRRPVDDTGVAWQLSQLTAVPDPPARLFARVKQVRELLEQAREAGTAESVEDLGLDPGVLAQYRDDAAELARPPVRLTQEAGQALGLLASLGLVAPAPRQGTVGQPEVPWLVVHRWTARALDDRTSKEELTAAHRRAAAYWRWRVAVWPQTRAEDVEQLLEARYHHHAAGDVDDALDANWQACTQLGSWGAWTTERQLWDEALGWVPPRSAPAVAIRVELGILAQHRGDYNSAEDHYQAALAICEEIGDRANIGVVYHQLGVLAYLRGDYDSAERRYQASLAIKEEMGDRGANIAGTYHQLGMLAQDRGDYDTAEQHYQASLAINEEIGDQGANIASSYGQLGNLAYLRGDHDSAEQRSQAALAIFEKIGDRANIANVYHQLGMLTQDRGDYDSAEQRYQASLAIKEEVGDRAGIAITYHQLGMLAQDRGDYHTAEQRYQASLAINEEIGDRPASPAHSASSESCVPTRAGPPTPSATRSRPWRSA